MEPTEPTQTTPTGAEAHPAEGQPDAERVRHDALQAEAQRFQEAQQALSQEHSERVSKIEDDYRVSSQTTEPGASQGDEIPY